ncbi:ABC transporter ATP-binding protein [uncultured Sneathiella sp.]|uniref:ABC transporter ATP-binding protein n=1 Tax=uncultured Sneathiella sp. TaxID=879315 RepID=UPI0030EEF398|tara:strand:+ start:44502 stop:45356 length:855 start_codon:yes stop_codon:yes gene_type:complete
MTRLEVDNLWVKFPTRNGIFEAVRGISFSLGEERLGIVGESGSGKSMTGRAILQLIRKPGQVSANHISLDGDDLLKMSKREIRRIRGQRISMVMQDPKFSLNPVMTVGEQMMESYVLLGRKSRSEIRNKVIEALEAVAIRDPSRVFNAYPHELSGGMGQRIMIAMMLIPDPDILIADEPTSALDVSVQMQVLDILDKLVQQRGMGLIFISHDLSLVSSFCDRVLIMYAGRIVEVCAADKLHEATHPYTRGLLKSLPRLDAPQERLAVLTRDPEWASAESVSGVK